MSQPPAREQPPVFFPLRASFALGWSLFFIRVFQPQRFEALRLQGIDSPSSPERDALRRDRLRTWAARSEQRTLLQHLLRVGVVGLPGRSNVRTLVAAVFLSYLVWILGESIPKSYRFAFPWCALLLILWMIVAHWRRATLRAVVHRVRKRICVKCNYQIGPPPPTEAIADDPVCPECGLSWPSALPSR